ncbi:hypothetical protein [Lentilactobacillus kosonis]|uniref:Uncharacterized protein n=1 Tax=Lentilactobacillus kosonis TaxID=2810561 RepID=A0A401FPI1_9LACO|nr:hypothetical protein [Lentilactobacillus kosonis]GAY74247.1 hypothetical protein NBRC111893_2393 [Lentilactobacillus kosonis]
MATTIFKPVNHIEVEIKNEGNQFTPQITKTDYENKEIAFAMLTEYVLRVLQENGYSTDKLMKELAYHG